MRETTVDTELVAYCGLYCGICRSYRKGKCPGCHENEKATWCKVRICAMEHNYTTCADCTIVEKPVDCKKLNNIISKIFALVFRTNRFKSLDYIARNGLDAFACEAVKRGKMTVED